LRGSVEKIKTLVAELKIAANFRKVNNTFPINLTFIFRAYDDHYMHF
jgi:hypothetical protein